jgi:hypothetical protein
VVQNGVVLPTTNPNIPTQHGGRSGGRAVRQSCSVREVRISLVSGINYESIVDDGKGMGYPRKCIEGLQDGGEQRKTPLDLWKV